MADKRPFAKIDVSYVSNPKWFSIHRALQNAMQNADQNAMQNAKRASMQAHFASILYCKRNVTDGLFPVAAIKAELDLFGEPEEAAITALFESGMWINHPGGMAEVRDFLEHQTESAKVKNISEKRRDAALSRWEKTKNADANSNANSNATSNAEERREEKRKAAAKRADILEVFDYLDSKLESLGIRKPGRGTTAVDEARLLIDKDGKTVEQIKAAIDFALKDEFWSQNIHSVKALRKAYDRIRMKAIQEQKKQQQDEWSDQ